MKKLFLLSICAILSMGAFAQGSSLHGTPLAGQPHGGSYTITDAHHSVDRTTSTTHDTLVLSNGISTTDTFYSLYDGFTSVDSGYFFGESLDQFTEFANRFDFTGADSAVQVIGMFTSFNGAVNPASTNKIVYTIWSVGAPDTASATLSYSGYPNTVLDTASVHFTSLGVPSANVYDTSVTFNIAYFATPTAFLTTSFFAGLTMNYTWGSTGGDTLGIHITDFQPQSMFKSIVGTDTIVNDQSMSYNGGTWYDNAFDLGVGSDFFMFPIVNTKITTGIKGISNGGFTFFGCYPNPANNETNIKFSIANSTDVTIIITDAAGHMVNTINQTNLSTGTHIVPVSTSNLPAGEYIYLVRTAAGEGMASKFTVIK